MIEADALFNLCDRRLVHLQRFSQHFLRTPELAESLVGGISACIAAALAAARAWASGVMRSLSSENFLAIE